MSISVDFSVSEDVSVSADVSVSVDVSAEVSGETSKPFNLFILHPTYFILPSKCSAYFLDSV